MNRHVRVVSGLLLTVYFCCGNVTFNNPCQKNFAVTKQLHNISSKPEKMQNLSDILQFSIDYKVDPCDDFYNFACGNWIKNIPDEPDPWSRITNFDRMTTYYQKELKEAVVSLKESRSKAIMQAVSLYYKCMTAEDAWKENGVSMIQHIWNKIKEYGDFPMLSEERLDDADIGSKFNLTRLFTFFNRDRSFVHEAVFGPLSFPKPYISFYPKMNVFKYIRGRITENLQRTFLIFIFRLLKIIAADVGVDYSKTTSPKDALEMMVFMEQIYSLSEPVFSTFDEGYLNIHETEMQRFQLDQESLHVNWTEYPSLISPSMVSDYIFGNPNVLGNKTYMERVIEIFLETTPRTLTNFVITHYILSRVTVLEAKYRKLVYQFLKIIGSPQLVSRRSELCFDIVKENYNYAILAIYAQSKNYGNDSKPILEEMVREITTSFKDQLNENKWIGDDFREAMLKKLDHMDSLLLYDEILKNFTALDEIYSEHLKIGNLPFLQMLNEVAYANEEPSIKLRQTTVDRKKLPVLAEKFGNAVGAAYSPFDNMILIPLNFVQYPLFNSAFPRAYIYGAVGIVIAHEISHGFDKGGMRFDHTGKRTEWYRSEWIDDFNKALQCYVQQYDNTTIPIFDKPLNGALTLNENVADNEGMKIVYKAFKMHQYTYGAEARTPFFEDLSNEQLFFIGFAKTFCSKTSDISLYYYATADLSIYSANVHAQQIFRVNNVVKNRPEFADAFFCPPGSNMNPSERCSLW